MNASVSALPREEEVQSKIRKIRAFGRNARSVCAVLFGLGLVGSVVVLKATGHNSRDFPRNASA